MAQFPNTEADMVVIASAMVAGYGADAAGLPQRRCSWPDYGAGNGL